MSSNPALSRTAPRRAKPRSVAPRSGASGTRGTPAALRARASVFAALGDATRLSVLDDLAGGEPKSIARLTARTRLTRQAVTKHLRVLEDAGIVRALRVGRESRFFLEPRPIEEVRHYLERISREWDDALARLKAFVEDGTR